MASREHEYFVGGLEGLLKGTLQGYKRELRQQGQHEAADFVGDQIWASRSAPVFIRDDDDVFKKIPDFGFGDFTTAVVGLVSFSQSWEKAQAEALSYLTKGEGVQRVVVLDLPYQAVEPHLIIGGDIRLSVFGPADGGGIVTLLDEVCVRYFFVLPS